MKLSQADVNSDTVNSDCISHKPDSFYEDGNGTSIDSSKWSPAYTGVVDKSNKGVIVRRFGVSPVFIRETLDMARYAAAYNIADQYYDGETGERISQVPGSALPQGDIGPEKSFASQMEEIVRVEHEFEAIGQWVGVDEDLEAVFTQEVFYSQTQSFISNGLNY